MAGDYKQALHIADGLLAIRSNNLPVLITAAECSHHAGMYDRAYQYADSALWLAPGNIEALTIFTATLVLSGRNGEAYKKATEILSYDRYEGFKSVMDFENLDSDQVFGPGLKRRIAALIERRNQDRVLLLNWCRDYKNWYETHGSQHPNITGN